LDRHSQFHAAFYNASGASYGKGTQGDLALALYLDAPPTAIIGQAVSANLAAQVERQLGIVNPNSSVVSADTAFAGGVPTRYLYEALTKFGHVDTALRLSMKVT